MKRRAAAERNAGEHMRLTFGADGKIAADEIVHVAEKKILESTCTCIEKTAVGGKDSGPPLEAAIGNRNDGRRQFSARHGLVDVGQAVLQESFFVLVDAMKPKDEWVFLLWVVAGGEVDVKIAFFRQRFRPNAVV